MTKSRRTTLGFLWLLLGTARAALGDHESDNRLLWTAAADCDTPGVEIALGRGADPNFRGGPGQDEPVVFGPAGKFTSARAVGMPPKTLPLCLSVLTRLVEEGADINAKLHGYPLIYLAAGSDNSDLLSVILHAGAFVDDRVCPSAGAIGETPLHRAAASLSPKAVRFLLDNGANPNAQSQRGLTPLHEALNNSSMNTDVDLQRAVSDVVGPLLKAGALPDLQFWEGDGGTPLHFAASLASADVTDLILKAHADVNVRDKKGATPLHYAVGNGHQPGRREVAELLVKNGADVNRKDNNGRTPLDWALRVDPGREERDEIIDAVKSLGGVAAMPVPSGREPADNPKTTGAPAASVKADGAPCVANQECRSGNCYDRVCLELKPNGSPCVSNPMCASKTCYNGICRTPN